MKKSIALLSVFTALTILDIVLTYYGTPGLMNEANPLSRSLGFGWLGLILSNMFAVLVFGIFSYVAYVKYETPAIKSKSFMNFYLKLFYNTDGTLVKPMFKLPKNWLAVFAMISFSACNALIAGRFVNVFEWSAVLAGYKNSLYFYIRRSMPLRRMDIWVFIIIFLISVMVWSHHQYKKSGKLVFATMNADDDTKYV